MRISIVLENLHRLSLLILTRSDDDDDGAGAGAGAVRVHALVQRTTREQVRRADLDAAARTAADAVLKAWPEQNYTPEHGPLAQSFAGQHRRPCPHHTRPAVGTAPSRVDSWT
jgi:hypothetical protein